MDGIDDLRHRGDLFVRVLGEQDQAREMALEGIMANQEHDADDYGQPAPKSEPPKGGEAELDFDESDEEDD